jgi:hypothetical protein
MRCPKCNTTGPFYYCPLCDTEMEESTDIIDLCNTCYYDDFGMCISDRYGESPETEVDYWTGPKVIKCTRYLKR